MLIFDYDGVLLNSLDDVVLTSWNAIHGSTITAIAELPEDYVSLMRQNRFHCQPAGDFLILAKALKDSQNCSPSSIVSTKHYRELVASEQTPLADRTQMFFNARNRLVEKSPQAWLDLNSVYQPLWNKLSEGQRKIIILTNKNKESVISSSIHFGLSLDPTNIYSGDNSATKESNLEKIIDRFSFKEIRFVDDSIKNLLNLKNITKSNLPEISFTPILAEWGFNGEECKALAKANDIITLDQKTFLETEL